MRTLNWQEPEAADALGAERRWADDAGNLTPGFSIVPGYPRLALVTPSHVIYEGDPL